MVDLIWPRNLRQKNCLPHKMRWIWSRHASAHPALPVSSDHPLRRRLHRSWDIPACEP